MNAFSLWRSIRPIELGSMTSIHPCVCKFDPEGGQLISLIDHRPALCRSQLTSDGETDRPAMGVGAADSPGGGAAARPSRYESQKRRDWQTFGQYLRNHRPPLELARCSGAHVLEFLRYLDQFGKTKVHAQGCCFFGNPSPPAPCPCPLKQAWGSLDALVGRLRAAFEEHGGRPEANPFGARAVRLYLREVRDSQSKARGIAYEKKRRKRHPTTPKQQQKQAPAAAAPTPDVPETAHFFIPQAHFYHGHFLAPAAESDSAAAAGSVAGAGDDIVLAMAAAAAAAAAAAEAHAAGCMMPLSVFN